MIIKYFIVLVIGCLAPVQSTPYTRGDHTQTLAKLNDDEITKLTYEQMFSCLSNDPLSDMNTCNSDTMMKINANNPSLLLQSSEAEETKFALLYGELESECLLMKSGALDTTSRILDVNVMKTKYFDPSSLSTDKKNAAYADFNTCVLGGVQDPSMPIYIDMVEERLLGGGKIVETGHLSPIYVGTCLAISLVKNDCVVSDLPESEVDELVREFTMIKDFLTVSVSSG